MNGNMRKIWVVCFAFGAFLGGCAPVGPGGASDVPWFEPEAWATEELGEFNVRPESDGSAVLLLTHLTYAQELVDEEDGVLGNGPHGRVYRLDPSTNDFELVGDEVWDDADGTVTDCGHTASRPSPFSSSGGLHFQDRPVPIRGRGLIFVQPAPFSQAVAVLTAEGPKSIRYILTGGAAGQHYHQLFSEIDGEPLGKPVRVPLITAETYFRVCWTQDEQYVIYSQQEPDGSVYDLLAVVDVADEMALLEDDQSP